MAAKKIVQGIVGASVVSVAAPSIVSVGASAVSVGISQAVLSENGTLIPGAELPAGCVLDKRFKIEKTLGAGAFGVTYQALDQTNKVRVCVKQLKDQSPAYLEYFQREIKALFDLRDVNGVPKLIAAFEEAGAVFYVQELIEGEDIMGEVDEWDGKQVLFFLRDMCTILKQVHAKNMIHRDIKPANIMRRTATGEFVLIDFGIVKQLEDGQKAAYTRIGTPLFMAPESRRDNNSNATFQSDLWSLGITAVCLYKGQNEQSVNEQHVTQVLTQQAEASAKYTVGMLVVLKSLLQENPAERFQSAAQCLAAIEKVIQACR